MAITAAVITGAILVGDSVQYSLEQNIRLRLGNVSHVLNGGERLFTANLAEKIEKETNVPSTTLLKTTASAVASGGKYELNQVHLWGIQDDYKQITGTDFPYDSLQSNQVILSKNTALRLNLKVGDWVLFRIRKTGVIPANTPFVSDDDLIISKRYKIYKLVGEENYSRFSLEKSQQSPFNAFVDYQGLSKLMDIENKSNLILFAESETTEKERLNTAIKNAWVLEDANLKIRKANNGRQYEIISERVFLDSVNAHAVKKAFDKPEGVLSYFVNQFKKDTASTPYSFVSGLAITDLKKDEIIINQWLADDLDAAVGDSIGLIYFTLGPLKVLKTDSIKFKVKTIVPIAEKYADKKLMPELPGMSDAGSCSDWNTGVPINLDNIRDKDEAYWNEYKGIPKAFMRLDKAKSLWANRFGAYTAFRFDAHSYNPAEIEAAVLAALNPFDLGLQLNEVKENGLKAARGGVDFGQLFAALSFFIIVSGILLTVLLFKFHITQREAQIKLFAAMGYSRKQITRIILSEQVLTAVVGALVGLGLALLYNKLVFSALNTLWQDIVRTNVLLIRVKPLSLVIGFSITLIVALVSQAIFLRPLLKHKKEKAYTSNISNSLQQLHKLLLFVLPVAVLFIIGFVVYKGEIHNPVAFFLAGGLLLIFVILLSVYVLNRVLETDATELNLSNLALKNAVRNRSRSLLTILMLSIGTFLVISTGVNKKDMFVNAEKPTSGTGGFLYYAESTAPVLKDLNRPDVKKSFDLAHSGTIVQFHTRQGDDASCLNLNRIENPKIIATAPEMLTGRFSFVTKTPFLDEQNPWKSLNDSTQHFIPAIADQTVIQWGLGKKVGDSLTYTNAFGEEIHLKLIGGLAASVFQGKVIISKTHFLKHFPYSGGSKVFLVDGNHADSAKIANELDRAFKNYGFYPVLTGKRLAEFKSVENTYLSIFLVMGAFGLLLGTVGIAVIAARSIWERRHETALLTAVGYPEKKIVGLYLKEYSGLLIMGVTGGAGSALIAVMPSLLSANTENALPLVGIIICAGILNGLFWITLAAYRQMRKMAVSLN